MVNFGGAKVQLFFNPTRCRKFFFVNRNSLTNIGGLKPLANSFDGAASVFFCAFFADFSVS